MADNNDNNLDHIINELERRLNYGFVDRALLLQALTHPITNPVRNFETLEFLGDSILNASISWLVYEKVATSDEGILARYKGYLASKDFISKLASQIGLHRVVTEVNRDLQNVTDSLICDIFEGLIGACFLDSSFDSAHHVIKLLVSPHFPTFQEVLDANPKSALQEWLQRQGLENPRYEVISVEGPEHNTTYTVLLTLPTGEEFEGKGPSKRVAEKNAAFKAVKSLNLSVKTGEYQKDNG